MISVLVEYDGCWEVHDTVGNLEKALALAVALRVQGHNVKLGDGPGEEDCYDG